MTPFVVSERSRTPSVSGSIRSEVSEVSAASRSRYTSGWYPNSIVRTEREGGDDARTRRDRGGAATRERAEPDAAADGRERPERERPPRRHSVGRRRGGCPLGSPRVADRRLAA